MKLRMSMWLFLSIHTTYACTDPVYLRLETQVEQTIRVNNLLEVRKHTIEIFADDKPTYRQQREFAQQLDRIYERLGLYDKCKQIYDYVASLSNYRGEYDRNFQFISEPTSSKSSTPQNRTPKMSNDSLEGLWVMDDLSSKSKTGLTK